MQVSEQIIAVLDNLAQKFGIAIDWGQQNVVPYIQQLCENYIAWEIASSIIWICFSVVLTIIGGIIFKCGRIWHEKHKEDADYEGAGAIAFNAVVAVCLVVALSIITYQVFDIVKCLTFPELKIFEYIKDVLTKKG